MLGLGSTKFLNSILIAFQGCPGSYESAAVTVASYSHTFVVLMGIPMLLTTAYYRMLCRADGNVAVIGTKGHYLTFASSHDSQEGSRCQQCQPSRTTRCCNSHSMTTRSCLHYALSGKLTMQKLSHSHAPLSLPHRISHNTQPLHADLHI